VELRHLEHFVAVAEELSFTRASRRLHVVQSGVSSSIQVLERELGATLFDRDRHRVILTEAGRALLPEARATLAAAQAATDAVAETAAGLRGALSIGTMISTGRIDVPALLGVFHEQHPGVLVRLRAMTGGSAELAREVASGGLDLALLSLPGEASAGLNVRPLAREPLVLICGPKHPLAAAASVTLVALADETFIDFPAGWGTRTITDRAFAAAGLERQVAFEVPDYTTTASLVRNGLGVAFVPISAAERLDGVARAGVTPAPLNWHIQVATSATRRLSAAGRAFLAAVLAQRLAPASFAPGTCPVHHRTVLISDDLETPSVVVDADRLEGNLSRMAAAGSAAGVALRPHAKTHKCLEIARLQLSHGAAGLTVATLAEAEAFATAGCPSVFIAYPLWAASSSRPERIKALRSVTDLRVGVDSVAGAQALAAASPGLRVLIEVDSGQHRSGVLPAEVASLAAVCLSLGLEVTGAFTHPGHAYGSAATVAGAASADAAALALTAGAAAAAEDERRALSAAGAALGNLIGGPPELSGGSSPTAASGLSSPLTEVRPGTYVFGDRQQTQLSSVTVDDVALVIAARVVSTPRPGEAVLDAGSKALSSDRAAWLTGHGLIIEAPEATIAALSEEHAVVQGLRDSSLSVGDLVRVVPNHVCSVVNLTHELVVVSNGVVTDRWPVVARH
jgi:D-serine deaminase-like pyridoxal phosphate-dependent protein/DNA-binding transcriptional LysR family regulator